MLVKSASPIFAAAAALLAAAPSAAHMTMTYPSPVLAQDNPFLGSETAIDTYTAPMSGRDQFPCRDARVIAALGTEAGSPVDTWNAGESQSIAITGGAFHGGGSCQLSLSYDSGETFKVIKSFIGNCPTGNGDSSYDVVIPADAPSGEAVFAWTWFNRIGNREMYMNCAVVTIAGGSSKRDIGERAVAFDQRPNIFVANIDGSTGCQTPESIDVDFPNPGEEVVRDTTVPGLYKDASLCADADNTGAGTPGPVGGDDSGSDQGDDSDSDEGDDSGSDEGDDSGSDQGDDSGSEADPTTTQAAATSATTTIPGGVFVTTPVEEATSAEASSSSTEEATSAEPTTFVTSTKEATTTSADATATTSDSDSGTETGTTPSATTAPDDSGFFSAGLPCADEGMWSCGDGDSFQRCASGVWSDVMYMAEGTSCVPGVSDTLVMNRKRGGSRIFRE